MSKERFTKLKFKIFGLKEPVLEAFPILLKNTVVSEYADKEWVDQVLRYVIFLYDPETDLNHEYQDLKDRKAEACALAGMADEHFQRFNDLDPGYVAIIQAFLFGVYHNRKYREWQTSLQELDDFTRMRWHKVDIEKFSPKQRSELSNLCDLLHIKCDNLEDEMFGDHTDIKEVVIADRWSSPEKFSAPTLKMLNG